MELPGTWVKIEPPDDPHLRCAEVLYVNDDGVFFGRFTGPHPKTGSTVYWWELQWPDGRRVTRNTTKKPSPVPPFRWVEDHL